MSGRAVGLLAALTFQEWVQHLIDTRYRTATAMAAAMGMDLTPFQRGVDVGTFKLENLLKLAKITDERPSVVLRMARKGEEATLIESLYGPDTLTPSQREVIRLWDAITNDADRAAVLLVLRRVAGAGGDGGPPDAGHEGLPAAPRDPTRRTAATARPPAARAGWRR